MKKIIFSSFIIILLITSSCKTIYYSGDSIEPSINFNGTSNANLELHVDTTILLTGFSSSKVFLKIFKTYDKVFSNSFSGNISGAARYKALYGTNYDLIVLPKYKIETKRGFLVDKITCYVEGYGGKYVLKNVNYINHSENKMQNSFYNDLPNYKKEFLQILAFIEDLGSYSPQSVTNAKELAPNDFVSTQDNYYGIVISNSAGMIKYLISSSSDKYELKYDNFKDLKKMIIKQ